MVFLVAAETMTKDTSRGKRYWLMKSEPEAFSIDDLARSPGRRTHWDGVRNYQARNFMRDMRLGDEVFFYHSNADPPAVVGVAKVVREAYPDFTQFDPTSRYHDPKARPEQPIWEMVDIALVEKFPRAVPIDELRGVAALRDMELLRRGSRLSITPVTPAQWKTIVQMAHAPAGETSAAPTSRRRSAKAAKKPSAAPRRTTRGTAGRPRQRKARP